MDSECPDSCVTSSRELDHANNFSRLKRIVHGMNLSIAQSRVAAVLLLAAVIPASPLHQDLPVHGPRVDAGRHLMPLRGGVANPAAQEHDSEGRAGTADLGALVRGPYDPEEHPNPLGDSRYAECLPGTVNLRRNARCGALTPVSSTTLSDVSSDVPLPEEAQRQIRQLFKEHEAMHGPLPLDQYVGQTFPVLERVLDQSEYRTYWRPGIVNKRLWAAAETGDDEEIEFLHQYLDADVNAVDLNIRNYTALFWAAMNGHHSTVDLLLKLGADITATDTHGSTPLHYAADRGWPLVVEALCAAGCGPWRRNSFGRTALEWALDFVAPYDASRTPIEDKLRLRAARLRPVSVPENLRRGDEDTALVVLSVRMRVRMRARTRAHAQAHHMRPQTIR